MARAYLNRLNRAWFLGDEPWGVGPWPLRSGKNLAIAKIYFTDHNTRRYATSLGTSLCGLQLGEVLKPMHLEEGST
jgi:hypothetical protein